MFAPKARAVLTGSTPRKVVVLHKVNDVDAYLVRTAAGTRITVPGSQLSVSPKRDSHPRQTR